ncbi:OstA-like protein [Flavobacterium sp.]|uniref:OstA-like protein n=1 Tax=Flavobacterium sp. TaxID=239 RepID=UPI002B4B66C4|nr:OstA-like protein [Flavobacterium sp.]HLP63184.1 OstA-like protein [Flavobacterium sp.]
MKKLFYFILFALPFLATAQEQKGTPIVIENADFQDINQFEFPDAMILTGNVRANHDGAILSCNKAYYYMKENYLKAFGNVNIVQGDTLYLHGDYAEYNGNLRQAYTTGNVSLRSPEMSLVTDKINFDRNSQVAYYDTPGTIVSNENTLTSNTGKYFVAQKKYQFLSAVTITNPKYVIKSNHLDYYTNSGHSYLYGPSTITSKENYIYTEKGFYNTKTNKAHFVKNSYIKYNDRLIKGDSLYYDRNKEFASATRNVKITDSINKAIIKGHYGEVYRNKDSLYITKRASVRYLIEKDSMFVHAKRLVVTGKPNERVVRGYNNVRFFKTDMSGKCDSLHSSQKKALTQLIGRPILWNYENQLTGDLMHLIGNNETEKLDSLKVLENAFIASKDTIGTGYNQVKGQNLYGKFVDNKLSEVDVIKNTEVVYYMRDDKNELIGINKNVSSKINIQFEESKINTITFFKDVDGDIYPEKELPENARKLRGFNWRGDERIRTKEDIFPPEENAYDYEAQKEKAAEDALPDAPMEVRKETLDYDKKNPPAKKIQ